MDEAIFGIKLCYKNARGLLREAKLLFSIKGYPRAVSLAVLAYEELAKIELIAQDLILDNKKIGNKFLEKFRHHRLKQAYSAVSYFSQEYKEKGGEYIKKIFDESKCIQGKERVGLEQLKQQGFYVDFDGRNFISPKRLSRKTACDMIKQITSLLNGYKPLIKMKPEQLKQILISYTANSKVLAKSKEWVDFIDATGLIQKLPH